MVAFSRKKDDFTASVVVTQQYLTEFWVILWIKQLMGYFNSANFSIFFKILVILFSSNNKGAEKYLNKVIEAKFCYVQGHWGTSRHIEAYSVKLRTLCNPYIQNRVQLWNICRPEHLQKPLHVYYIRHTPIHGIVITV